MVEIDENEIKVGRLQYWWIWCWYNDVTRLVGVLLGLHVIPTGIVLYNLGVDHDAIRFVIAAQYLVVFGWALIDNDYTNLNKIGLTVHRTPLRRKNK